jgi:DNA-binding NtrC family response regulator
MIGKSQRETKIPLDLYLSWMFLQSCPFSLVNKYAAMCNRGFKGIASGSTFFADAIQLAGQRSRAGERHRARHRDGTDRRNSPRRPANALLEEQSSGLAARYHDTLNQTKSCLSQQALNEANGSPVEAARLLGIHLKYLHRLICNLNFEVRYETTGISNSVGG